MKKLLFIFTVFIVGCSNPKNQKQIDVFETVLGDKNVEVLNLLVNDFENNLEVQYPKLKLKDAYKQYLLDIKEHKTGDASKFMFLTKKTQTKFHESGFWDEIYYYEYYSKDLFTNTIDSTKNLQLNNVGKYMAALYEIKDSDSLIYKYWDVREAAGFLPNNMFVDGILYSKPDFDNYFHKRIVVIEYSF